MPLSGGPHGKRPRRAVALGGAEGESPAGTVTAKGMGEVADKIIALARDNGIPVRHDPDLVEVLARLDLMQEIPPDIYLVVAEILAFAYEANARWRDEAHARPTD